MLGVGFGGCFHLWKRNDNNNTIKNELDSVESEERWFPCPFITGHFSTVNDLVWSSSCDGSVLYSVSSDQTCRIFAELKTKAGNKSIFREISRPQIHGYDLNCIVQSSKVSDVIYTGGEEKVIRVFEAPNIVLRGLKQLCGVDLNAEKSQRFLYHQHYYYY